VHSEMAMENSSRKVSHDSHKTSWMLSMHRCDCAQISSLSLFHTLLVLNKITLVYS
jgi:hypothetical protein